MSSFFLKKISVGFLIRHLIFAAIATIAAEFYIRDFLYFFCISVVCNILLQRNKSLFKYFESFIKMFK